MTLRRRDGHQRDGGRDHKGSGSVLTLITVGLVLMAFVVVIVVGSYLVADHRAVAAADQAALSGARAHGASDGPTPCEVAGRSAELNDARVVECRLSGDRVDYVVQVVVAVDVGVLWPGLPAEVRAGAHAGRMSG